MQDIIRMYIGVTVDEQPEGLNLCCWMSPDNQFEADKIHYPYQKLHITDVYQWLIYSNQKLTLKMWEMLTEYAERTCVEGAKIAARRLAVNR